MTKDWYLEENRSDRFARCTDGDSGFLCYTRLHDQHAQVWFKIASDPSAALREIASQEEAKLEADVRRVRSTDIVVSAVVAAAADGAKRRKIAVKGPPTLRRSPRWPPCRAWQPGLARTTPKAVTPT